MKQSLIAAAVFATTLSACGSETLKQVTGYDDGSPSAEPAKQSTSSSSSTGGALASALSSGDIAQGLKEALSVGTEKVVTQLSAAGGFANDPKIHIPLPKSLQEAQKVASQFGAGAPFEQLESKLNEAAEAAAPQAKELFLGAIEDMSIDDARGILNGPQDSATKYLQSKMSNPLGQAMKPVVDKALADVGAVQVYEGLSSQLGSAASLVPDLKANLSEHVVDKGMSGIFQYLAVEEAAIRENPVERTTDLLKKVFAQ